MGARGVSAVNALRPASSAPRSTKSYWTRPERGREFLLRTPMKRFGKVEEAGRRCRVSCLRRGQLRDRRDSYGGWRLSGEWSQSVGSICVTQTVSLRRHTLGAVVRKLTVCVTSLRHYVITFRQTTWTKAKRSSRRPTGLLTCWPQTIWAECSSLHSIIFMVDGRRIERRGPEPRSRRRGAPGQKRR
mgnify:CR=1 FL=1